MRSKLAVTAATGVLLMLAAAPAGAQEPYYTGSGWGPIAAQAANAVTGGPLAESEPYADSGVSSYAYAPGYGARNDYNAFAYEPGYVASTGYDAFAYSPGNAVTGSWNRRGFGAYAYAPGQIAQGQLALANYGLGMSAGAYCARRFRSYDPSTGTYLGFDGQSHPCP